MGVTDKKLAISWLKKSGPGIRVVRKMSIHTNKKDHIVEIQQNNDSGQSEKDPVKKSHLPRAHFLRGKFRMFGHYVHAQFLLLAIVELLLIIGTN